MLERLKRTLSWRSKRKHRSKDSDVNIQEETDTRTWRDESKPTWGNRLAARKAQIAAFLFLGVVAFGLIGAYSKSYLPGLYGSAVLQAGTGGLILTVAVFIFGVRWTRGRFKQIDWLVLFLPDSNGIGFYVGTASEDLHGNQTFKPVKGFDIIGLRGSKLTLGDLGDDIAENFAKQNRNPDDPAVIRVEDGLAASRDTWAGTVIGVLTGGLEYDAHGRESDLYATPPNVVDPSRYRSLAKNLRSANNRISDLEDEIAAKDERAAYWKSEAQKSREEVTKDFVDDHAKLAEAGIGGARTSGRRERRSPDEFAPENNE